MTYQPKSDPKPLPPFRHEPPPRIPQESETRPVRNERYAAITRRIQAAIEERESNLTPFCDVTVKVQDGQPVLVEILTKHKPGGAVRPVLQDGFVSQEETGQDSSRAAWLNLAPWDRCADDLPSQEQLQERACIGGLDMSIPTGIAAFVLYLPAHGKDQKAVVKPYFWIHLDAIETITNRYHWPIVEWANARYITVVHGSCAMEDLISQTIQELRKPFTIIDLGFDPWNGTPVAEQLTAQRMRATQVRQGFATLNEPTKELRRLVTTQQFAHDGNPVLRAMIAGLVMATDADGNERPDAKRSAAPISGVVALLNAMARALASEGR